MAEADLQSAVAELRRNYDRCSDAILHGDPDEFIASFGPTGRGETAEGVAITVTDMYDYIAWRMGRTVEAHSFVIVFDSVEGSSDEVRLVFTEDSSATVLDVNGKPVVRNAHSINSVVWKREGEVLSQVAGHELEVVCTIDGVVVGPDADPVGVPAYRVARS